MVKEWSSNVLSVTTKKTKAIDGIHSLPGGSKQAYREIQSLD